MLGCSAHSQDLGPEYLYHGHCKAQENVQEQGIHCIGISFMLTERCRCLVYKITVEYAYVERTVVVYSGYTALGLHAVTALVKELRVLVLTGCTYVPSVLLLQFMQVIN